MSEFYVQDEKVICGAGRLVCTKPATHRVMRVGKIDYGLYCHAHAEKKVRELERMEAARRWLRPPHTMTS